MMKGKRRKVDVKLENGEGRRVEAVVFGPLAMYPMPDKVKKRGRLVNGYIISHITTGLRVMTIAGADKAREAIGKLLEIPNVNWDFLTKEQFAAYNDDTIFRAILAISDKYWKSLSRHEKRSINADYDKRCKREMKQKS
jgi:hypothetical protein